MIQRAGYSVADSKSSKTQFWKPISFILTGFVFTSMLIISAFRDFYLFGWLATATGIVFGLMFIHFSGEYQTVKNNTHKK